jgi:hypothetical protein
MSKLSALLTKRMKGNTQNENKMDALAKRSSTGDLSSFSGVFRVVDLSDQERSQIQTILQEYQKEDQEIEEDLTTISQITSEVKAINNQAIMLHGERIKKTQSILRDYHDGAFSAWLIATYGNRQTPYNFLQYFDFYSALNNELQKQVDCMPKQVIYTLASRNVSDEQKQQFIQEYNGQTRDELIGKMRTNFALDEDDKRKAVSDNERYLHQLERLLGAAKKRSFSPSIEEKNTINMLLDQIRLIILKK